MIRLKLTTVLVALLLSSCAASEPVGQPTPTTPQSAAQSPDAVIAPSEAPDDPAPATSAGPVFRGAIAGIGAERLPDSWRPGCPVPVENLRLLTVTYWDFAGVVQTGELVINRDHADKVLSVMRGLFDRRFPIERMELIDKYQGDDDLSMAANNTSAFNCRPVSGRPGTWSQHSYGWALDINPVQNPYISNGVVSPPSAAGFTDRSLKEPGMILAGDSVVKGFGAIGWKWGGNWSSAKDYQHFSATGR